MVGDLVVNNGWFEDGEFKCHKRLDFRLTNYGDMMLTETVYDRTNQEIMNWLGTVPGERLDPRVGCVLHDYMYRRAAVGQSVVGEIENVLAMNIKVNFPHLPFKYVTADLSGEDTCGLMIYIEFMNDALKFLVSAENLKQLNDLMKVSANMEFVKSGVYV